MGRFELSHASSGSGWNRPEPLICEGDDEVGRSKASAKGKDTEIVSGPLEAEVPETEAEVETEPEAEVEVETDVEVEVEPELEVAEPDVPDKPVAPVKRTPGVKEVIPFKWKLVGAANGLVLTLFKSVEREDADAQLVRIAGEGYYKDLRILDADAPVAQSSAPSSRIPVHKVPTEVPKKQAKSKRAAAAARKTDRPTSIKVRSAPSAKPVKAKASSRGGKKKPVAPVKSRKKRTAKKK